METTLLLLLEDTEDILGILDILGIGLACIGPPHTLTERGRLQQTNIDILKATGLACIGPPQTLTERGRLQQTNIDIPKATLLEDTYLRIPRIPSISSIS